MTDPAIIKQPSNHPAIQQSSSNPAIMQKQIDDMQKLLATQLQIMQLQTQQSSSASSSSGINQTPNHNESMAMHLKNVKIPNGRYDMNSNEFRTYKKDCVDYKKLTHCTDEQVVLQMRMSMDHDLKQAIDANYKDTWDNCSVDDALSKVEALLRKISTPVVHRKLFDGIIQHENESAKEFITKLKICAADCDFVCPYDNNHNLSEYHIINRIRSGILDKKLQQELLQQSEKLNTLKLISDFCENFESAKNDIHKLGSNSNTETAISHIGTDDLSPEEVVAAISSYKKRKQTIQHEKSSSNKKKCFFCGYDFPHPGGREKCPAKNHNCKKCDKKGHFERECKGEKVDSSQNALLFNPILKVCSLSRTDVAKLPTLNVYIGHNNEVPVESEVVADTGAQVTVAGTSHMKLFGIKPNQLTSSKECLKHAGGKQLNVLGSYPMYIIHNKKLIEQEIYFVTGVTKIFLSLTACKDLCLVDRDFPLNNTSQTLETNNISAKQKILPEKPKTIPFPPTSENIDRLENWFKETFKDTTFDITNPLPVMSGPPQTLHLKENAIPYAATTPIPIPHHWKKKVKQQLDDDVSAGVLQKAPIGVVNEWCMRMVTVRKKNGDPRRTVDYQPINKFCHRETHHTPRPFDLINNIPGKTYKTVLDAHNGYHQVLLDEKSVPLTTFITEYGRYQYLRAPQGHIASGDAYTRRYDDIIASVQRKIKIVDDVLLYDNTIEESFFHVFDFLYLCATNGITLNPEKFKFAKPEVNYCGFFIGWESYRPSDDMINAIHNFPMPTEPSITDIRAWFGVVNQLAPFLSTAPIMEPFRDLLKTSELRGKKVFWDNELQQIFNETKQTIVDMVKKGLSFYDTSKETALITDWAKCGIGLVLLQKHCGCKGDLNPFCCQDGWKLVFCASRSLLPEESNYATIEGEALAVAWGLKKARLFLLGCPRTTIFVDHNPLVKIFGNKSLIDIDNPRLLHLKEKALAYNFDIKYIKGLNNHANVFSRYPADLPDDEDKAQVQMLNSVVIDMTEINIGSVLSLSLEKLKEHSHNDTQYQRLLSKVKLGSFSNSFASEIPILKEFYNVRDRLSIVDNLVMYAFEDGNLRTVIPKDLRNQVIKQLHSANQGTTSMLSRARKSFYWPGMDRDINNHVESCRTCKEMSPSNTKEPLINSTIPEYPFQDVASDLFEIDGYSYLAYVDRLTAFAELAHLPISTSSYYIINVFRDFFHRWGIPEEISLDGASNLQSSEIKTWLTEWGVRIRKSSAYYPQSNGRAEAGVKSLKRLLIGNTGIRGSINTDEVASALLQYRNTPLRNINKSPAELALGRELRDTLPLPKPRYRVNPHWALYLQEREKSMSLKAATNKTQYDKISKELSLLQNGDKVLCQNTKTKKWDRSGTIVELAQHRQYLIKMDGSGRLSHRNRRHLKKCIERIPQPPQPPQPASTENITPLPQPLVTENITPPPPPPPPPAPLLDAQNVEIPQTIPVKNMNKIPRALKNLQSFNKPGLKDI